MCFICFICFFVYAVSFIAMLQSPSLMVLFPLSFLRCNSKEAPPAWRARDSSISRNRNESADPYHQPADGRCASSVTIIAIKLNIFRDRLCKALQDRGTSPGLEGSSDSRSARVSLDRAPICNVQPNFDSKVSKESDVYSIRLSTYCKPNTAEVIIPPLSNVTCKMCIHRPPAKQSNTF